MKEEMNEAILDLLCKKAVYGLTEQEEVELMRLQRQAGIPDESLSFELTAAALSIADIDMNAAMPANLRNRIVADANRYFDERKEPGFVPVATTLGTNAPAASSMFGWLGWALAAAACLVLAVNLYNTRFTQTPMVAEKTPVEATPAPADKRTELIATAPDLARGSWGAGNVQGVVPAGDIVWSDSKQTGYMRLQGLPVNDPNKETYQLWIFDETQSDKTPIDGGTFNVSQDGEVIVPINAKLAPRNTKMYAITVEKPGGVVVSDRSKIVALAKRET